MQYLTNLTEEIFYFFIEILAASKIRYFHLAFFFFMNFVFLIYKETFCCSGAERKNK